MGTRPLGEGAISWSDFQGWKPGRQSRRVQQRTEPWLMVHSVLGYIGCHLLELNVEWHLHGQGSACCHISLNPGLTWRALDGSANWKSPQNNETLPIKLRAVSQSISHVSWGYTLQTVHQYSIHKEFHHVMLYIWLWSCSSHISSATYSKGFHVVTEF